MAKKSKNTTEAPSDRRLGPLIDQLGPINNACRMQKASTRLSCSGTLETRCFIMTAMLPMHCCGPLLIEATSLVTFFVMV